MSNKNRSAARNKKLVKQNIGHDGTKQSFIKDVLSQQPQLQAAGVVLTLSAGMKAGQAVTALYEANEMVVGQYFPTTGSLVVDRRPYRVLSSTAVTAIMEGTVRAVTTDGLAYSRNAWRAAAGTLATVFEIFPHFPPENLGPLLDQGRLPMSLQQKLDPDLIIPEVKEAVIQFAKQQAEQINAQTERDGSAHGSVVSFTDTLKLWLGRAPEQSSP